MHCFSPNIFNFARKAQRPLIFDGAMGSLLQQLGVKSHGNLWTSLASINEPEMVLKIHSDYIISGADVITTNTFRSNPVAVSNDKSQILSDTLVKESLRIARLAIGSSDVLLAGSNPPAEDCYQKERTISNKLIQMNHRDHINLLIKYGCDFVLNETQSHLDEIEFIGSFCRKQNIPFVISLFFTDDLRLLSGEYIVDILPLVESYKPLAIGFNCISPATFQKLADKYEFNYNWGIYFNCGSGNYTDPEIRCGINENEYLAAVKNILVLRPSFIGACCGSNPKHIKQISEYFNGLS